MVLTLAIPLRKYYHLEELITIRHLDIISKVMLATGMIVAYAYLIEAFMSFYSGSQYEKFMLMNRMTGPYKVVYWGLITCQFDYSAAFMVSQGTSKCRNAVCNCVSH